MTASVALLDKNSREVRPYNHYSTITYRAENYRQPTQIVLK
jgi:hypothetical protein